MKVVRGYVEHGQVVLDELLAEGAEVTVVVAAGDESFDLDEEQIAALSESIDEGGSRAVRVSGRCSERPVTAGLTVVFTTRATTQAQRALAWWRENRPVAPDLLEQEPRNVLVTHASRVYGACFCNRRGIMSTRVARRSDSR